MGRLYASLAALGMIWGTSFLFIKILLNTMGPAEVVFGRTFFGAFMLLVLALFRKKRVMEPRKLPYAKLFLIALANNVIPWLLISTGETRITSSLASIINATTPLWTLIIGFLFFSAKLKRVQWIGAVVGFAGIFVLSEVKTGPVQGSDPIGILLMSGAALCYGIGSHMSKKFANNVPIFELSFVTMSFSAAISFIFMAATGLPEAAVFFSLSNLGAFAGLGALGSGIAYLLYYFLVQKGSPELASLVTYLAPVFGILWGALLLNEPIGMKMILGLFIIFAGVYISSLKKKGKPEQKAEAS